jgi:hypothetical protein
MIRLHFDLHNGTGLTRDEEGRELADDDDPRGFAIHSIRSILSEEVLDGLLDLTGWIDIRSDTGGKIGQVTFREAVTLRLKEGDADDRDSSRED